MLLNAKGRKAVLEIEPWHTIKKNITQYSQRKFGHRNCASTEQIKMLWYRSSANRMKNPKIQRIDISGLYTVENLTFVEL